MLPALPEELRRHLAGPFRGLVLVGPPSSGKTTLLRSVSALLSRQGKKTTVVDERMEIWPCGAFGFAGQVPLHGMYSAAAPSARGSFRRFAAWGRR